MMERVSHHLRRLLPFPFRVGLEYETLTEAPATTLAAQIERGEIDSPGAPPPTLAKGLLLDPPPVHPGEAAGSDVAASSDAVSFEVQNVTGIFSRSEELCLGLKVKGLGSPWSIVFQRDDEQRILDCSRVLDVQRGIPDEDHFTIKFGPRVRLETFHCNDMEACVEALHRVLWRFSELHGAHLVKHRRAIYNRRRDVAKLFTKLSKSWYKASLRREIVAPAEESAAEAGGEHVDTGDRSGGLSSHHALNLWDVPDIASELLTPDRLTKLHADLPRKLKSRKMELLYCSDEHGFSSKTLFRQAREMGPAVLVIQDQTGCVFGGFASEYWRPEKTYFGTGESFVFTFHPHYRKFAWKKDTNDFFLFADQKGLGMGGGGEGYAFWIDSTFKFGSSHKSATFGNFELADEAEFICFKVELWGFELPIRRRKVYGAPQDSPQAAP